MKIVPLAALCLIACSCAPAYRYDSSREYSAASSTTDADKVKAIVINARTTGDNKDRDLAWNVEVHDNTSVLGRTEVGAGDEWRNDSTSEIVVKLDKPFRYEDRKQVQLTILQKTTSKDDHAWRGWLEVNGVMGDNSVRRLIEHSKDFQLGERGNSKSITLSFQ
jgi:hypothetical protein